MSVERIRDLLDSLNEAPCGDRSDASFPGGANCGVCHSRVRDAEIARTGNRMLALASVFIVCNTCGNKRCPRATWHGYACSGSNDTNQTPVGDLPPEAQLAAGAVSMLRELLEEIDKDKCLHAS